MPDDVPPLNDSSEALHKPVLAYLAVYDESDGQYKPASKSDVGSYFEGLNGQTGVSLANPMPVSLSSSDSSVLACMLAEMQRTNKYLAEILGDEIEELD